MNKIISTKSEINRTIPNDGTNNTGEGWYRTGTTNKVQHIQMSQLNPTHKGNL
jgi:hypothetical protein